MNLKDKIRCDIIELINYECSDKFNIDIWFEKAKKINANLKAFELDAPDEYWHYFSDIDIRIKDKNYDYKVLQIKNLKESLKLYA